MLAKFLIRQYQDDPTTIEGICLAHFFKGEYDKALNWLDRLRTVQNGKLDHDFGLLHARALENSNRTDEAISAYDALMKSFTGEEARCRYANLLKKNGNIEKANSLYKEVLNNARLNAKYYKKTQKQWIAIAKKGLS